jgi:hypothetical protein
MDVPVFGKIQTQVFLFAQQVDTGDESGDYSVDPMQNILATFAEAHPP